MWLTYICSAAKRRGGKDNKMETKCQNIYCKDYTDSGWPYNCKRYVEDVGEGFVSRCETREKWEEWGSSAAAKGSSVEVPGESAGLQDGVVEMKKGNHYAVTHIEHYQCMACWAINIHENHNFCPNCGLPIKWVES